MFERVTKRIEDGIGTAFPCAAFAIGRGYDVYTRSFIGNRQHEPYALPLTKETLFDIASLSKLVSTTMVALKFMEEGWLSLDDRIGMYLDRTGNHDRCEIHHLLTHTSGLVPHMPLFTMCKKEDVIETILSSKPLCGVGDEVHYSCMGYILLGHILEKIGGKRLDLLAKEYVFEPLSMKTACYIPEKSGILQPFAVTEYRTDLGKWMSGEVHDENAYHMDGIAGNAGVFATLDDMIAFAGMCSTQGTLQSGKSYLPKEMFLDAIGNKTPHMAESRGYGFQLKDLRLSPMGMKMSDGSYGHTGFTGTSLYVDKKSGLWGLLLTNSVHLGRNNRASFYPLRRGFYDLMIEEYEILKEEDAL